MSVVITDLEIPDLTRPLPDAERPSWAALSELKPFQPARLDPDQVRGRTVAALSTHVGTYGMGGPGFFGLHLGDAWLVISVWGAASWMHCDERLVEDYFHEEWGRPAPWITPERDDLTPQVVGTAISSIAISKRSLDIALSNGLHLEIRESPVSRPILEGSRELRAFAESDDLRDGVFLSPTTEIWV